MSRIFGADEHQPIVELLAALVLHKMRSNNRGCGEAFIEFCTTEPDATLWRRLGERRCG